MQGAGLYASITPVPLRGTASAVVCAGNDQAALHAVLSQLEALPLHEIIVVLSAPSERMFSLVRSHSNAIIANLPGNVDPDTGRALGAKLTGADSILFVDGEQAVDADRLAGFLWECDGKADIALNDVSVHMGSFHSRGAIERFHEFLNASLERPDLKMNTLSTLPFAISRTALDTISPAALAVPAKAHAMAIINGLKIVIGGSVEKSKMPETTARNLQRAAGDHVEAWREAMNARGSRLSFTDSVRNRSVLGDWER
jgi:hypothetical protein